MSSLFDIGRAGLQSYRRALSVTGQNIANVNTDGYKRREASLEEVSAGSGGIYSVGNSSGLGVRVADITRSFDEFLLNKARNAGSNAQTDPRFDKGPVPLNGRQGAPEGEIAAIQKQHAADKKRQQSRIDQAKKHRPDRNASKCGQDEQSQPAPVDAVAHLPDTGHSGDKTADKGDGHRLLRGHDLQQPAKREQRGPEPGQTVHETAAEARGEKEDKQHVHGMSKASGWWYRPEPTPKARLPEPLLFCCCPLSANASKSAGYES